MAQTLPPVRRPYPVRSGAPPRCEARAYAEDIRMMTPVSRCQFSRQFSSTAFVPYLEPHLPVRENCG